MKRIVIEKTVVTLVLVAWWLLLPVAGYEVNDYREADIPAHFAYILSHANIWHLMGNLFVLWIMSDRLYLLPSLVIAVLSSFVPATGLWPLGMTVGFSGVLFAIAGIKWGVYCRHSFRYSREKGRAAALGFVCKVLPFALAGALIPHINWCLHLYCLLAGFVYGRYNRN